MHTTRNYLMWSISFILGICWTFIDEIFLFSILLMIGLIPASIIIFIRSAINMYKSTKKQDYDSFNTSFSRILIILIFAGASMLSPIFTKSIRRAHAEELIDAIEKYHTEHQYYPVSVDSLAIDHHFLGALYVYDTLGYEVHYKIGWWTTQRYDSRRKRWYNASESVLRMH